MKTPTSPTSPTASQPQTQIKAPELVRFVRDRKNRLVGVVLATQSTNGVVYVSGSKCKMKSSNHKGDIFSKDEAIRIARERIALMSNRNGTNRDRQIKLAFSLGKDIDRMVARAEKYFKTDRIIASEVRESSNELTPEKMIEKIRKALTGLGMSAMAMGPGGPGKGKTPGDFPFPGGFPGFGPQ